VCLVASGCGFYEFDFGAIGLGEAERAVLAEELGVLDSVAPPEPTNAFADDAAAAVLGAKYFFDPAYSATGTVSCATCHDPATGFQDTRAATSLGLAYTGRHAPTCLNAAMARNEDDDTNWQFWDGRMDSLWSQALGPPESAVEMGGTRAGIAFMIFDRYRDQHERVFGPLAELRDEEGEALYPPAAMPGDAAWEAMTPDEQDVINAIYVQFGKAIDAYERVLVRANAPFDAWYEDVIVGDEESEALTPSQVRGLELFIGKANCIECHSGPNFTDQRFHNLGVRQEGQYVAAEDRGRAAGIEALSAGEWNCASKWSDHPDKSACAIVRLQGEPAAEGAFKTPSLRNVADTAPYMHTGRFATLDEVVRFYDRGGDEDGFEGRRDPAIVPLNLSEAEIADLVAFLEALTGEPLPAHLTDPPELPEPCTSAHN
jgi:cytochrome c peroxidase